MKLVLERRTRGWGFAKENQSEQEALLPHKAEDLEIDGAIPTLKTTDPD